MLAAPGLLRRGEGLGCRIGQELLAGAFPLVMMPGEANITAASVLKTASACDRVMVLLAKDSGLLPGSLSRDTKAEFGMAEGESVGPRHDAGRAARRRRRPGGLDGRTTAALADHIVREMASY